MGWTCRLPHVHHEVHEEHEERASDFVCFVPFVVKVSDWSPDFAITDQRSQDLTYAYMGI